MKRYKITISIDTDIPQDELPGMYTSDGCNHYPGIKTRHVTVEVVKVKPTITDLIALQSLWIEEHGVDLTGYIANYGSKNDPNHSGVGGEGIYAADLAELRRLEELL